MNNNCYKEGCSLPSCPNDLNILLEQIRREVKNLKININQELLKQNGKIAETVVYIKNNLSNEINTYIDEMKLNGELDDIINDVINEYSFTVNKLDSLYINPIDFGCNGNGLCDDSTNFNKMLDFARSHNKKVICNSDDVYLLNTSINCSNVDIDFNNCLLKTCNNIDIITINTTEYFTYLHNVNIDCTNALSGLKITEGRKVFIDYIKMNNINNIGIQYLKGYEIKMNHIDLQGNGLNKCIGLDLQTGDSTFKDVILIDCYTGINNKYGFNIFEDVHAWILHTDLCFGSTMFKLNGSQVLMNNIYCDTYHYLIKQEQYYTHIVINNLAFLVNGGIMTVDSMQGFNPMLYYSSIANDIGKILFINSGYIKKPTNFTVETSNVVQFYGVNRCVYEGNFDKETFNNHIVPTYGTDLTLDRCNIDMDIHSVDLDIRFKINMIKSTYINITLDIDNEITQLPIYEMNNYSAPAICGVAYIQNGNMSLEINDDYTLTVGKYILIQGHIRIEPQN